MPESASKIFASASRTAASSVMGPPRFGHSRTTRAAPPSEAVGSACLWSDVWENRTMADAQIDGTRIWYEVHGEGTDYLLQIGGAGFESRQSARQPLCGSPIRLTKDKRSLPLRLGVRPAL